MGAAHAGLVEGVLSVLPASVGLAVEVIVKALPACLGVPHLEVFEDGGHLVLVGLGDQEDVGILDILLEFFAVSDRSWRGHLLEDRLVPHVLERQSLNLLPEEGIVFSEVAQDRQGGRKLARGQLDGFSISFQLGLLIGHGYFFVN